MPVIFRNDREDAGKDQGNGEKDADNEGEEAEEGEKGGSSVVNFEGGSPGRVRSNRRAFKGSYEEYVTYMNNEYMNMSLYYFNWFNGWIILTRYI
jgi:hypothetical protein